MIYGFANIKEEEYEEHLKDKLELLELYKDIVDNDRLVLLYDKIKNLTPKDMEQALKITDTFNKETIQYRLISLK